MWLFCSEQTLSSEYLWIPIQISFSVTDWIGITLLLNSERAGCARMEWMWVYLLVERKNHNQPEFFCMVLLIFSAVISCPFLHWALLPQERVPVACAAVQMCVPSRHWPQICLSLCCKSALLDCLLHCTACVLLAWVSHNFPWTLVPSGTEVPCLPFFFCSIVRFYSLSSTFYKEFSQLSMHLLISYTEK